MDQLPSTRNIRYIVEPRQVIEGAGVRLRRSFAPDIANQFDPFLLFDHFSFKDPVQGPIAGFPTHPHRGIETVTYMLEGFTRHRDSLGNVDTIGPGDVQWMTAGGGILHEEMPRRDENGRVDGFQLWVNLPAAQKMTAPRYQGVTTQTIPAVAQDGITARIVAGEYAGVRGPVTGIAAQPLYMDVTLAPGATFTLPTPPSHQAFAYLFEGEAVFGADTPDESFLVPAVHMIIFEAGDLLRVNATPDSPARFLIFAGAPFREPIFPYGPFVMNTREEIIQAFDELRNGTFVRDSAI
jgi:redox-sensitive bicupin YhaK (pirin superfamily)